MQLFVSHESPEARTLAEQIRARGCLRAAWEYLGWGVHHRRGGDNFDVYGVAFAVLKTSKHRRLPVYWTAKRVVIGQAFESDHSRDKATTKSCYSPKQRLLESFWVA